MKRKLIITVVCCLLFVGVWFLAVDQSWFIDECPTCGYMRHVFQFRVLTLPAREDRRNRLTILQRVAADVGVECRHPLLKRFHRQRLWGLYFCACPCNRSLYDLDTDDSWYDEAVSNRIKQFVSANPHLRNEFVEKVLEKRDFEYYRAFLSQATSHQSDRP
jgi:hypothetical protein